MSPAVPFVPHPDVVHRRLPTPGMLFVPARAGRTIAVRMFRTAAGDRAVIGFSSLTLLHAALGEEQEWVQLSRPALLSLAAPLGILSVTVDPATAPPALTLVANGHDAPAAAVDTTGYLRRVAGAA